MNTTNQGEDSETMLIADKHEDATILFCDIVGIYSPPSLPFFPFHFPHFPSPMFPSYTTAKKTHEKLCKNEKMYMIEYPKKGKKN